MRPLPHVLHPSRLKFRPCRLLGKGPAAAGSSHDRFLLISKDGEVIARLLKKSLQLLFEGNLHPEFVNFDPPLL